MEIRLAKEMGMCFGVRMTLDQIDEAIKTRPGIDTLGTLVHNPQLVDKLSAQNIEVVGSLGEAQNSTVAVTAHGAAPEVYKRIADQGSGANRHHLPSSDTCAATRQEADAGRRLGNRVWRCFPPRSAGHPRLGQLGLR